MTPTQCSGLSQSFACTMLVVIVVLAAGSARAQPTASAHLDFDIVGIRLTVGPPVLTVPKNTATQINTALVLPSVSSADAQATIAKLTAGTIVEAELRGPAFPTRHI